MNWCRISSIKCMIYIYIYVLDVYPPGCSWQVKLRDASATPKKVTSSVVYPQMCESLNPRFCGFFLVEKV